MPTKRVKSDEGATWDRVKSAVYVGKALNLRAKGYSRAKIARTLTLELDLNPPLTVIQTQNLLQLGYDQANEEMVQDASFLLALEHRRLDFLYRVLSEYLFDPDDVDTVVDPGVLRRDDSSDTDDGPMEPIRLDAESAAKVVRTLLEVSEQRQRLAGLGQGQARGGRIRISEVEAELGNLSDAEVKAQIRDMLKEFGLELGGE